MEDALTVWRRLTSTAAPRQRPQNKQPLTYRVITRVLQERSYPRTELRRQLVSTVQAERRSWKEQDPAQLEIWAVEYAAGTLIAGLRLSDEQMRQHGARTSERPGALRPTVASAMVQLAGVTDGGLLLDPCCGSGTILAEAAARGWRVAGRDVDESAVGATRRNVRLGRATVARESFEIGDARDLDLEDGVAAATVSNLPFGRQYAVDSDEDAWLGEVLGDCARVTRPGGRVVLLAPRIPRDVVPAALHLRERHPVRVLGTPATIWVYDRRYASTG